MAKVKPYWCWHYHHRVLVELVTESIADRIAFNRNNKPKSELETRERLIHEVRSKLPAALIAARAKVDAAWDKANAAWDKVDAAKDKADAAKDKADAAWAKANAAKDKADAAWAKANAAKDKADAAKDKADAAWAKANAAWDKADVNHMPAILKLHAKECPNCPWDGATIFPEKK